MRRFLKNGIFIALVLLVVACSDKQGQSTSASAVELPGEGNVLVTVNGSKITEYDLKQKLNTLLGEFQTSMLDEQGRDKALESMVMSRVIAQAAEKQLTAEERKILEKRLESHRENLLVNYYLKNHAGIQPVTDEMIKEYYESHPEKYGAKTLRIYEMLFSDKKVDMVGREKLIAALKNANNQKDWNGLARQLQKQGLAVNYRKGNADEAILENQLKMLISGTKVGETTQLTFLKGKPYIIRVLDERQQPARPLQEVSTEIRKTLAPIYMKETIKKVADDLMKTATVDYANKK